MIHFRVSKITRLNTWTNSSQKYSICSPQCVHISNVVCHNSNAVIWPVWLPFHYSLLKDFCSVSSHVSFKQFAGLVCHLPLLPHSVHWYCGYTLALNSVGGLLLVECCRAFHCTLSCFSVEIQYEYTRTVFLMELIILTPALWVTIEAIYF